MIITSAILAGAFIVSLGAISIKDRSEDADPTPTPTASDVIDESGSPIPSSDSTPACTSEAPADREGAETLIAFDDLGDARVTDGAADLTIDPDDRKQGEGSLRVNLGQREQPAIVRAAFDEPVDIQAGSVGIWMRQNGGVYTGGLDWAIRLSSDGTNAFEQVLQPIDVTAAIQWCHFTLDLAELRVIGRPDPSQIRLLEVAVPRYAGAGSGNTIWLDGVSFG